MSSRVYPANMEVFDSLKLHITSDKFIVEPFAGHLKNPNVLVIDRVTQDISLHDFVHDIPASAITKSIYGIIGIIRLVAGPYLIVVTEREKVGHILNNVVWKVTKTELLCYKRSLTHLNERQITINKSYLSLMEVMLNTEHFYYSPTFDLSHTVQRLYNTSPEFTSLGFLERADQRFIWNSHALTELSQQPELSRFCLPMILGYVSVNSIKVNGKTLEYVLVSRRSIYRAGTRFNVRGLDLQGQAANFVETEQIVMHGSDVCSFVQTRGSIPLFWTQKANLKRLPNPVVMDIDHMQAFQKHFDQQVYVYGNQVIVNLINQDGPEQVLEKKLAQVVTNAQNENIRYEPFDFHKECKKMRWDRLSILMERLKPDMKKFGYFMELKGSVVKLQGGVFRTNCIDCLDRTNVVQSLIAKEILQEQLVKLGLLRSEKELQDQKAFDAIFKNVWADNADVISKEYAGTGALKTDFTRTGKRTLFGALMDGYNSVIRYVKNNFQDGSRQDAMDLFLGNYIVEENEGLTVKSPLESARDWKYYAVPVIFLVAFSMFMVSVLLPDEHLSEQMLYVLFWGMACFLTLATMLLFGAIFVDQPKLAQNKVKSD
ncbi:phosphatidylinositol-3-phosphatase SAC1-like isoform X1 [Biomphalaria glabrata]|uniref:Phosphatidylinositol-3-phosphatase SAC1 n=1 Tax=Biomphalaria glabrata TaxID=6526 RepID=A0A9W3AX93_BIOGL|nr:phosphatidylinositol-3-phosphatase SAC1-like isoform X1 [Biomphalaria glabrata]